MAAYTPYELLRMLVNTSTMWRDEAQKQPYLDSIDEWETMGVFGNVASALACQHENVSPYPPFKCPDCGRLNP